VLLGVGLRFGILLKIVAKRERWGGGVCRHEDYKLEGWMDGWVGLREDACGRA